MSPEAVVFIVAMAFSFLAFSITMHNVPMGAIELNPVLAFSIGAGIPFIGFIAGWVLIAAMYKFIVFGKRFNLATEQKYLCLGLVLGITFLDFFSDFMGYLYIISL